MKQRQAVLAVWVVCDSRIFLACCVLCSFFNLLSFFVFWLVSSCCSQNRFVVLLFDQKSRVVIVHFWGLFLGSVLFWALFCVLGIVLGFGNCFMFWNCFLFWNCFVFWEIVVGLNF